MKSWNKFLDDLDNHLYKNGWYVQGRRIKDKNYKTDDYESVIKYLTEHCYSKEKSIEIVVLLSK